MRTVRPKRAPRRAPTGSASRSGDCHSLPRPEAATSTAPAGPPLWMRTAARGAELLGLRPQPRRPRCRPRPDLRAPRGWRSGGLSRQRRGRRHRAPHGHGVRQGRCCGVGSRARAPSPRGDGAPGPLLPSRIPDGRAAGAQAGRDRAQALPHHQGPFPGHRTPTRSDPLTAAPGEAARGVPRRRQGAYQFVGGGGARSEVAFEAHEFGEARTARRLGLSRTRLRSVIRRVRGLAGNC